MSTAIDAAIVATLQADSQLATLAPGGVWPDLAPEQATTPYVVVTLENHEDVPELNGITAFEQADYIVTAVDKSTNAAAANAAFNRANTVLAAGLSISGYTTMDVVRRGRIRDAERDGPTIWRYVGARYHVEADPT